MKFFKIVIPIVVIILLSYWAIKPLSIPGFFPMHDDTQVARVSEMTNSLKDGMFPVRWVSNLGYGYGYPIFNFYAPLAYYVGSVFMFLGLDALSSTKLVMGLGVILSGIFMYLLAKEFWGKLGGLVSAIFYMYAPFHAVDIYVRGDVAEFWAYAFIPLSFLGLYKTYKSNGNFKWVAVGALGYTGIILSHNLTAMMVSPFLLAILLILLYISYRQKKIFTIYYLLLTILLGLSLAAFYFIPALLEQKYTNVLSQIGGGAHFEDHFVCLSQLWQSQWGFGGSAPGCSDGLSFMIGKIHIILSLLAIAVTIVFVIIKKVFTKEKKTIIILLCVVGLLASIFLMLSLSQPLWSATPLMAFFQFPWRFLLIASFFSSLLVGSILWLAKSILKNNWIEYLLTAILILLVISNSSKFFAPWTILGKTSEDYTNIENLRWETSKISDEYLPKDFPKPGIEEEVASQRIIFDPQSIEIIDKFEKTNALGINLIAAKEAKLHFNVAHFPSWKVFVDGVPTGEKVEKGYLVSLPSGAHKVGMKFEETPVEKLSNFVSLAGLVAITVGIIRFKKKSFYE